MLQINLTIKGTNTVLRTWKANVTLSIAETQELCALLKLAIPTRGYMAYEVVNEIKYKRPPLLTEDMILGLFRPSAAYNCRCATLSPQDWDDFKKRLEEAKTVKEFLGGK